MVTVGDFVPERLRAWGVRRICGYPGDGINGIMALADTLPFVTGSFGILGTLAGNAMMRSAIRS